MRIALVTHAFPPQGISGIGRYVEDLAEGLAGMEHDVVVAVSKSGDDRTERRSGHVVSWIPDIPESGTFPFLRLLRLSSRIHERLRAFHGDRPFDVVEAPNTWAGGLLPFRLGLPGKPLRVTRLSTPRAWFQRTTPWLPRLTEWLEYFQVASSDLVISNTRENLELSRALYPLEGRQTDIVYHGIPDPGPPPPPRTSTNEPSVLYVGRMEHRKGFDVLVGAWPSVFEEFPQAKLHVVGEDLPGPGGAPSYFEWSIRSLTAAQRERIHFHGETDDMTRNRLFTESDIVVVPSRYESFGLVLLEAMIREKPVVASATGGMKEIVEHAKTGLLVTPESSEELAAGIISLLSDAPLRLRMGAQARSRVLERYTVDQMATASVEAYRQAIALGK
ncbi:glycosyltransferase family 4 protein [endosymbiont of unidentified scaly snail isolate Monju]|uniref:glycosyltransferase family 4 protein n=1 Tax=endosymbiont of unidentified scaly snail isolate Monju TaxID=1248727 RepID=UPI0003892048|nr:glycosyltransferase family 4 protein [endosymbiont of unidentified scaly snail isolate Monju]BAN69953.1 glycosyl transferase group 1 [endosymbiont of unidentified scaly snail isolate Monju]